MDLEIHYLDVGQGDCTLILFKENDEIIRSVVIDCGGSNASEEAIKITDRNPGQKLLDFCRDNDVEHFDIWIITHWDKDHITGFTHILEEALDTEAESIRNMLIGTIIYDRGEYRNIKLKQNELSQPDFKTDKKQYIDFRRTLYKLNKNWPDLYMDRPTETVFGNTDLSGRGFKLKGNEDDFELINTKPEKGILNFVPILEPYFILGRDLLNYDFTEEIPDASLTCIAVNQYYLNSNDTIISGHNLTGSTDIENRRSIGMLLQFGKFSCWFGGDLETAFEEKLIPKIKKMLGKESLTVCKASHHGSTNSTSEIFLNKLNPRVIVVSSPPDGKSHPHPKFIERVALNENVKKVYLTGCRVYVGYDEAADAEEGKVINGVFTSQLLGLTGDPIPDSDVRKFYVCGGINSTNDEITEGNVSLFVEENSTDQFRISYWESCAQLRLEDTRMTINVEEFVDERGDTFDGISIEKDAYQNFRFIQSHRTKKRKGKKRKREEDVFEIIGGTQEHTHQSRKKRRLLKPKS